jgi:hypothetical protein
VQIEDAERHRQAFAAIDDPHQIGVLQIVIGQLVAAVAVLQQQDFVQRPGTGGEIAAGVWVAVNITRQAREVLSVAGQTDPRPLERGKRQRRLADRQDRRTCRGYLPQVTGALLGIEGVGQLGHCAEI